MFNTMLGSILSWICGGISSIAWLFVFIPQIIEILQIRSVKGVSYFLILFWLIGDILSLESAVHLEVNTLIVYTGLFQISFDLFFMIQWLMYKCIEEQDIDRIIFDCRENTRNSLIFNHIHITNFVYEILKMAETQMFLLTVGFLILNNIILTTLNSRVFAFILAWISACAFAIARVPQIILNNRRQSVYGLSYLSFVLILIANGFYLLSILIKMVDYTKEGQESYIIENLSWLVGTSISIILNCIILYQFKLYSNNEEEQNILMEY